MFVCIYMFNIMIMVQTLGLDFPFKTAKYKFLFFINRNIEIFFILLYTCLILRYFIIAEGIY